MDKVKDVLIKKGITRNIIIIVAVAAVIGIVYFVFIGKNNSGDVGGLYTVSSSGAVDNTGTQNDVAVTSQQFLAELANIDSIKIDDTISTNPAFVVLQDLSRPIGYDTNPGRVNPFAPLGADSASVSTQITTNDPTLKLANSTVLNGTLSISGANITRWFEYGTTETLGTKTKETPQALAGIYSENIAGLAPSTTYYAKAAASIGGQVIYGNLVSWSTSKITRQTRQ